MGTTASQLLLGKPLVQYVLDSLRGLVHEHIVVAAPGQELPRLAAKVAPGRCDIYPGKGPLGGIYTGLSAAKAASALVLACDMPLLQPPLLAELLRLAPGYEALVTWSEGRLQPLCAAYSRACIDRIERRLRAGDPSLADFLSDVNARYLRPEEWRRFDAAGRSFLNLTRGGSGASSCADQAR